MIDETITNADGATAKKPTPLWIRFWPLYIIFGGLIAAWRFGLFDYLSLESLREFQETQQTFINDNFALSVLIYIGIYAAATTFMLPGALWITIAGGLLFGLGVGVPATVIGATLGASMLFFAARTSIGAALRERAGPFVQRMEAGFNEGPLSFMFAMRFMPAVPFPVSNIAPALLGAKYRDYAFTTALGIIPGVIAYTWIGVGLRTSLAAGAEDGLFDRVAAFVPAFAALAVVSLLPIAYKKFFAKKPLVEETPT